jgi:hypothetical protein
MTTEVQKSAGETPVVVPEHMAVKVGWSYPNYDSVLLNVHFFPLRKKFQWSETISLTALNELYELVCNEANNQEFGVFPGKDLQDEPKLQKLLTHKFKAPWDKTKAEILVRVAREVQQWLENIVNSLPSLPRDVSEMVKQYFFRSVEKIEVYESLTRRKG